MSEAPQQPPSAQPTPPPPTQNPPKPPSHPPTPVTTPPAQPEQQQNSQPQPNNQQQLQAQQNNQQTNQLQQQNNQHPGQQQLQNDQQVVQHLQPNNQQQIQQQQQQQNAPQHQLIQQQQNGQQIQQQQQQHQMQPNLHPPNVQRQTSIPQSSLPQGTSMPPGTILQAQGAVQQGTLSHTPQGTIHVQGSIPSTGAIAMNASHAALLDNTIRPPMGQTVQVIQQPMAVSSTAYLQQLYNQQIMLQNAMAAMQGLNHQQLGMSPRSPGMMSPIPQSPTTVQMSAKSPNGGPPAGSPGSATASPTKSNNTKSPNGSQPTHIQPQVMLAHPGMPANMMGKAMIQRQGSQPHNMAQQSQPFFIQQLGTMIGVQTSVPPGSMSANQNNGSNAIRSQASSTQNQILSPGQIRLSNPAQLVTQPNQPTMITSPTVLNQLQAMAQFGQNIPIAPQQLIGTQSPTILTNAPMFIRAAGPMQTHHACMVQNMPNQATKGAKVAVEQGVRPTNPATVGKVTGSGAKSTGSLSSSNKSISALLASANKAGNNNKVTTTTQVVNSPQAAITKPQTPPAGTPGTKPRTTAQHILPKQVQKVRGRQMAKPSVATATVTGTKLTQAVTTKPSTMSSKTTTTASKPQSVKPSTNGSKPTTVGSKSTSSPKLNTSGTKSAPTGSKPTMSGPKPSPSGTKPSTIGTKPSTGSKLVMGGSKIRQTSPKGSTQSKPPTNITSPLSTPVTSKKTISHIKPATSSDASSDSGSKPDGASSSESLSSSDNKQHQGGDKSQSKKTLINSNKDVKLNGNDKINDEVKTNGDISVNGHSESSGDKEENMEVDNDIIPSPTASPTEDKVVSLTNVSTSGPPTAIVQGERQKAIVKPQVLTHVIEGFVIQEGPDPFPPPQKPFSEKSKSDGGPPSKIAREEPVLSARATDRSDGPTLKCEFCGRVMMAKLFKRSKRFCTTACAKRYNVGCSRRMGLFQPDQVKRVKKPRGSKSPISGKIDGKTDPNQSNVDTANLEKKAVDAERDASSSSGEQETESTTSETTETSGITEQGHQEDHDESSNSPAESDPAVDVDMMDDEDRPPADAEPTRDTNRENMPQPTRWTVREVYEFIHSLPGCETYADEFRSQEIDGQALLLLKEDHLMTTMNIKLGPALKICAKINALKDD